MPKKKATLKAEALIRTKAEVSCECAQHWSDTQTEFIHSLKNELKYSRVFHEDLGFEMRGNNSLAFMQDQWTKSWVHKLIEQIFSLGFKLVAPPSPPAMTNF